MPCVVLGLHHNTCHAMCGNCPHIMVFVFYESAYRGALQSVGCIKAPQASCLGFFYHHSSQGGMPEQSTAVAQHLSSYRVDIGYF